MNATATDAVRAYVVVTQVFDLPALWQEIDALDNVVPTDVADAMVLETRRLLDRAARWLLSNRPQPLAVGAEINRFAGVLGKLAPKRAVDCCAAARREAVAEDTRAADVAAGVPAALAARVALAAHTYGLLDVIEVAELAEQQTGGATVDAQPGETAELYYALSDHLDIDQMLTSVSELERGNRWHALARLALRDDLYCSLRAITLDALRHSDPGDTRRRQDRPVGEGQRVPAQRARVALDEITQVRPARPGDACRWRPARSAAWCGDRRCFVHRCGRAGRTWTSTATSTTRSTVTLLEEARIPLVFAEAAAARGSSRCAGHRGGPAGSGLPRADRGGRRQADPGRDRP